MFRALPSSSQAPRDPSQPFTLGTVNREEKRKKGGAHRAVHTKCWDGVCPLGKCHYRPAFSGAASATFLPHAGPPIHCHSQKIPDGLAALDLFRLFLEQQKPWRVKPEGTTRAVPLQKVFANAVGKITF